jgi:hypothetical protein
MNEFRIGFTSEELNFLKSAMERCSYLDKPIAMSIFNKIERKLIKLAKISSCKDCKDTGWIRVAPDTIKSRSLCNRKEPVQWHDLPYWKF